MLDKLRGFFNRKKVLILGFGLEGKSTLQLLEKLGCAEEITVADRNPAAVDNANCRLYCGEDYLRALAGDFDIIMKTPGIALFSKINNDVKAKVTSQTDLFLRFRENTTVGVTGTKGKSTTASLIYHILRKCGCGAKLIGNIGVPPLDVVEKLAPRDIVVMELSCHQLEYVQASPDIAILLNIYEEHLDHYVDFAHYKSAKENIFRFLSDNGVLIRGDEPDEIISRFKSMINPAEVKLRGEHNLYNMAVAVAVAVKLGCGAETAIQAACGFAGLPHRLELFAETGGIKWVNDSISTVPAAAIAAVKAFPETDVLIIGGMDRGIDYTPLVEFLNGTEHGITNVICLPDSGHRIAAMLKREGTAVHRAGDMAEAVNSACKTAKKCCVLSPAAASYGFYRNFEERGEEFKRIVKTALL